MYSGGVPTRHTQMGRPTYEAPTREYYTHKHTQTQTNTQRGPTKYGADSRRGGALLRTLYRPDQGGHADVGVCPKYYRNPCGPLKYPFAESLSLSIAGGCVASTRPPR